LGLGCDGSNGIGCDFVLDFCFGEGEVKEDFGNRGMNSFGEAKYTFVISTVVMCNFGL
jgi:hypothetical protein